ncbi:hypothetical protein ACIHJG_25855 [Streptomyces sp. NPDC052415]|uniref:hypothetical protein n=1 Tax=Streptomyces sp. NPDC052415 TaxID=3365690 RepID=UPI0037D8D9FD
MKGVEPLAGCPARHCRARDLDRSNDGHPRTLPVPATYVIDRAGTIRWAFVDTDYTTRGRHPGRTRRPGLRAGR